MPRFTVVSPQESQGRQNVGTYAESFGWTVKDTETGHVHSSGDRRNMVATARILNRREG